jgi:23S rRNA-/tRNA-specific pseudouridylate synthase
LDLDRLTQSFFSRYHRWDITLQDGAMTTVIEELARRLPDIDPSSWARRFELGGVYLGGRETTPDSPITTSCRLEYYDPLYPIDKADEYFPAFKPEMILSMDEDIGVAWKPAGLPTTAPRDQQLYNFQCYLTEHLKRPVHLPSRLDTGVAGLLLFSLSPRMNRHLQKAYDKKLIEKHYIAEVVGDFTPEKVEIRSELARDPRHPVLRRVVSAGGESAHTVVQKIDAYKRAETSYSLLQVEPLTGRTHQIRVHLAAEGFPIVGDPFYNGARAPELRLLSYALRLYHPYKRTMMTVELPKGAWPDWLVERVNLSGPFSISYREEKRHEGCSIS